MNRNNHWCSKVIIRTLILAAVTMTTLQSCSHSQWKMPDHLIGRWVGIQSVTTRDRNVDKTYRFVTVSLPVVINIQRDGKVSGFIGAARFFECKVDENRGLLGMKLDISEFKIDGFLQGRLNERDEHVTKEIDIPFYFIDSQIMKGTIFMTNEDIFPMSGLTLKKELSPN